MREKIIFEAIPYTRTASEKFANKAMDRIVSTIKEMENVGILNIPEIVEENHIGQPYYKNLDTREFGRVLREKTKKDIMLNTVVAHYNSKENFEQWLENCVSNFQIKNFVFVGAKIDSIKYPGPSITEANLIAKKKNLNFGNIFIPYRHNEADRLISKTISGCNFFTSQVLFEPEKVVDITRGYIERCNKLNLKPAKFFLSFAPVSTSGDIDFLRWLGVGIRGETEKRLKNAENFGEESIKIVMEAINGIFNFFEKNNIKVPLGLNIEYITLHNLELAKKLVDKVCDLKIN